jgi:steroid delta-isomerase-like uncharacterized protein
LAESSLRRGDEPIIEDDLWRADGFTCCRFVFKCMSADKNRAVVESFLSECVNGDLDRIGEFVAEDYVGHDFPGVGDIHGPEEFKAFFESLRESFEDMEARVEDVVAESDEVVVRATVHGTHTGSFLGIEPTGERVRMTGIRIFRIENGKIAEIWLNLDIAGVLEQLGVLPDPISL